MGDLLNEYIIPYITGREIEHCENAASFSIMGIGSCGGAIWGNKEGNLTDYIKDTVKKIACSTNTSPCAVWGTGFLMDFSGRKLKLLRKETSFIAVRGMLTQRVIENSLGKKISPVLCDGGILASELVKKPAKEYEIGFIPHYNETNLFDKSGIKHSFEKMFPRGRFIDLHHDPIKVIEEIGQCEAVLSSSLHGCIVADSFHIPNMRVKLSDIPGSGYKFDDYYSGYGIENLGKHIKNSSDIPSIADIIDSYKLTKAMIDDKKKAMADCLVRFASKL